MAEGTTRRLRKDPRRGMLVTIPKEIAERLPDEAEVEFDLDEQNATVLMREVEIQRKAAKLKPAKA